MASQILEVWDDLNVSSVYSVLTAEISQIN